MQKLRRPQQEVTFEFVMRLLPQLEAKMVFCGYVFVDERRYYLLRQPAQQSPLNGSVS